MKKGLCCPAEHLRPDLSGTTLYPRNLNNRSQNGDYGYTHYSTNESKQDINQQIKELKAPVADEVVFVYEHGNAKAKKIGRQSTTQEDIPSSFLKHYAIFI